MRKQEGNSYLSEAVSSGRQSLSPIPTGASIGGPQKPVYDLDSTEGDVSDDSLLPKVKRVLGATVTESDAVPPAPQLPPPANELSFFDRQGVKAASFIVGIIGLIFGAFGVWSYFASVKEPAITYTVNPIRTTLVQTGGPSGLSVQFNGERLTEAVTSVTLGIWNAGRGSVKASNVLESLELKLPPNNRILSAKVLKQSRPIIQFQLGTGTPNALESRPQSTLHMGFNVLEHNDSAIVQVIYEGQPEADVMVTGIFDGQPKVLRLKEDRLRKESTDALNPYFAVFLSLAAFAMGTVTARGLVHFGPILGLFLEYPTKTVLKAVGKMRFSTWMYFLFSVCSTSILFTFGLWVIYIGVIRTPPFSFSD